MKGKNRWQSDAIYAAVTIDGSMKDACLKWISDAYEDFETLIQTSCAEGYRISVKYDFNNACFQASHTQQDMKHWNAGIVLTSRSDDPLQAIMLNEYKLRVLFPEESLPTENEMGYWG